MNTKTITITIAQLDEVRPTRSGMPQRRVKTATGRWIFVRGRGVESLGAGDQVVISEPTEFPEGSGKFYAQLRRVAPRSGASVASAASLPVITSAQYFEAMQEAHALAANLEPDSPEARAALVNTAMIAFTSGRIKFPAKDADPTPWEGGDDEEGSDIPF